MPSTSYAENLVIPHPERPSEEGPQPLLAIIDPESIGETLQRVAPADYDEMAVAATDFIASQVRAALWYPERKGDRNDFKRFDVDSPVPIAELTEKQVADCFGFTIVTSECMEIAGINHWVGFANGHSVLLYPIDEGRVLHMTDPLSHVLSQYLEHSIASGASVPEDMRRYGRSAVELDTRSLVSQSRGDDVELLKEHYWLMFQRGDTPVEEYFEEPRFFGGKKIRPSHFKILMSIFNAAEGRQILQDYNGFELAYNDGDYLTAASRIQSMRGIFPNIDARRSHAEIKRVVAELGRHEQTALARRVLDSYFESFVLLENDSRFKVAHGDALRILAREGRDPDAAQAAIDQYYAALDRDRYPKAYREMVRGKLAKAVELCAALETGEIPGA